MIHPNLFYPLPEDTKDAWLQYQGRELQQRSLTLPLIDAMVSMGVSTEHAGGLVALVPWTEADQHVFSQAWRQTTLSWFSITPVDNPVHFFQVGESRHIAEMAAQIVAFVKEPHQAVPWPALYEALVQKIQKSVWRGRGPTDGEMMGITAQVLEGTPINPPQREGLESLRFYLMVEGGRGVDQWITDAAGVAALAGIGETRHVHVVPGNPETMGDVLYVDWTPTCATIFQLGEPLRWETEEYAGVCWTGSVGVMQSRSFHWFHLGDSTGNPAKKSGGN